LQLPVYFRFEFTILVVSKHKKGTTMKNQYKNMNIDQINKSIADFNIRIVMDVAALEMTQVSDTAIFHVTAVKPIFSAKSKLPKFITAPINFFCAMTQLDNLLTDSASTYLFSGKFKNVVAHLESMDLTDKKANFCKPITA
jgi:hypothetical protein